MAALQCRQCSEPVVLEGSAFWTEPSGANARKCGRCGAELTLEGELPEAQPGDVVELGEETFSALSSGIIDTKRLGANGAAEREAQAFARALVRAQLMDAVSDAPPSSRDEEVTVVIGPVSSRAKRAALAKMAAEREAAATAEHEPTLATTPSDELIEMSSPDASERITSDRITTDVSAAAAGQNSTDSDERRLPGPPARPALPVAVEEALEEIEAAPVSDGGTPSLQALIGHPVAMLPQGVKQIPVLDKSRVPKPPERTKDEAPEEEMVESVDLASVEATEPDDSGRESDGDLRSAAVGEIPTLAPTNVTAPPPALTRASGTSKSRWATPLSFAALGSLFAVILALRTPKSTDESVAEASEPPRAVAAARAPEGDEATAELAVTSTVDQGVSSVEPVPPPTGVAPVEADAPPTVEAAASAPAPPPVAAAAVMAPTSMKPRARSKPAAATEPFDASAANASLAQAQTRASSCRKADDPSGVAQVTITFAPSGRVTTALVAGPPFAGTQTGGCVASTLRSARVPPFLGDPVTVRKTVTIQ